MPTFCLDVGVSVKVVEARFPGDVVEVDEGDVGPTFLQRPSHTLVVHILYNMCDGG